MRFTNSSMSDDVPSVPIMIAVEPTEEKEESLEETFLSEGLTPVTCWMSDAKSNAARCTPGHSSEESRIGAALPLFTNVNADDEVLKVTQVSCPIP